MNIKILKILLLIGPFLLLFTSVFAFEAKISIDKNSSDINDYIKLRVQIKSDNGGNIGITNIKGIENFDIITQSQSQSSSTSMVMNNGKTQSKTTMSNNLDLTLRAKAKGNYKIGPAILKKGNEEVETNVVGIKITGDKLFLNNNHLNIPKAIPKKNIQKINPGIEKKEEKINLFNNVKQKEFNDNKSVYLLLVTILIVGLIGYFIIKNNPQILNKINKNKKSIDFNPGVENKQIKTIDFDIKISDIIYPEVRNNNFISEISDILKQKIAVKYKINKIKNKTFEEIIEIIGNKIDNDTKNMINMVNKAKYSNIIGDNNKILEMIKEYK